MKKILLGAVLLFALQSAWAQNNENNQNQQGQNGTQQTTPNQGSSNTNQNPSMNNQTMPSSSDWDLYGGTMMENNRVPQSTSAAFKSKYPNQQNVSWYSYDNGYIAAYPGSNHSYEGVLYDKNGKMTGTVTRVKYSTLSSSVTANMKKKYPNMNSEYVYKVTSPTGKVTYVSNVNGTWSDFSDSGMYSPDK